MTIITRILLGENVDDVGENRGTGVEKEIITRIVSEENETVKEQRGTCVEKND